MQAKTLSILLGVAVAGFALVGCTTAGRPPLPAPPPLPDLTPSGIAGPEPIDYRSVISISLEGVLRDLGRAGPLGISQPRRFPSLKGPAWIVCIRSSPNPIPRYYAIFFQHNRISESRASVVIDHCELQSFTPFDWSADTAGAPGLNPGAGHLR